MAGSPRGPEPVRSQAAGGERRRWPEALAAAGFLLSVLLLPAHPGRLRLDALALPLEWPVMLLLLALSPRRLEPAVRAVTAALVVGVVALKLADIATEIAYNRGFNPILDAHLLHAAWMLLTGAIGAPATVAATLAALAATALLAVGGWWAAARIQAFGRGLRPSARAVLAALLVPALALPAIDLGEAADPPGAASTVRLVGEHVRFVRHARADLRAFRVEAARDPFAATDPDRVLGALRGHDVVLIFVESYGRGALDNPRFRPTTERTLTAIDAEIADAGLVARSAYLTAPMVGGQSWLAHASVLSGLWIDNQRRYQSLLTSPRRTLLHLADRAGWRTVGVMPAITLPWPESAYFGFDAVYEADDLGYAGRPFNWVTMPDQYTLSAFERLELAPSPRPPVFAQVALISSHAPWTPIPPLIDWTELGDGRVFDRWATSGDPPEVVWRDRDRIRDQYRQAVAYALAASGSFAARRGATEPLIVILGDHQPAAFVSEDETGRDVPVHLIGPPALVAEIEDWGWSRGMIPADDAPAWPMDAFRDRFLAAFGSADPAAQSRLAAPGAVLR
jgi:hypothetical protein